MLRSKILWAIVLGILSSVLILEARINFAYSPVWNRILHALATPGVYFVGRLYPADFASGGWARLWVTLARVCNFAIYVFFWYVCIWIISYLRTRQHPYDRESTLVPRSLR